MSVPTIPLLAGLVAADLVASGATWWGSELAGREGLAPAIAVLLVASPLGFLVARYAPLPVSRRLGRRSGVSYLGASADLALPRLRQLVIEVEHVLTTGHLVVVDVAPLDVQHKHDLRWFAGALAHGSTDPVARAIARLAGPGRPTGVSQGPAHELQGAVDRHPVRFGLNGVDATGNGTVGTTVRVDVDQRPMGHITVADEVRKTAARCLSSLREEGIEPILVSSTLNEQELMRVSEQVGVSQYHTDTDVSTVAATLPPDTTGVLRAVGASERAGETTLPGDSGEDTVVRSADPSIDSVLESIKLVRTLRRARRVARACAATFIVVAVPLAATGILAPVLAAIAAMAGLLLVAAVACSMVLMHASPPAED
jgi:cation transport ATPase